MNSYAQLTEFEWAVGMGDANDNRGFALTSDNDGNVYTTGYFFGTVDFDPGASIFNLTSAGNRDLFLQKLDSLGNFIWAFNIGGTSWEEGLDIISDHSGNIYLTGYFYGSIDFDPGAGSNILNNAGGADIFILKLRENGDFVWAKNFEGETNTFSHGMSICVDDSGYVYTTGYFENTVDFDPGVGVFNLVPSANDIYTIYVNKLDSMGDFVWAKSMVGDDDSRGFSVSVDNGGNVYTTGWFEGTVDFDPSAGVNNVTSSGNRDGYVQKLDLNGNVLWTHTFGSTLNDYGYSLKYNGQGNVIIAGTYAGTVDFNPGAGTDELIEIGPGSNSMFVLSLDQFGIFEWVKPIDGQVESATLKLDSIGNVYIGGMYIPPVDFDPGPGIYNTPS